MRLKNAALWVGGIQGLVLWWLWRARELALWPASDAIAYSAFLYVAVALPLVIYCTQDVDGLPARTRRLAVAGYAVLMAALGAHAAWATGGAGREIGLRPANVLATAIFCFVSLNLLCGFDFAARRWNYARLFNHTWRNGILLATAAAMTGAGWLVLLAGGSLMELIGVGAVMRLLKEPAFIFPVSCLVFAAAFSLGLTRAAMTESIRRFWLSISSWLLPLVLFFGVLWVAALPFTGLAPLFETRNAALLMLWFSALAVKFSNCAYQDGEVLSPYPAWLGRTTQLAWLSLLPVVAIAWWALGLRVAQHGLSEQRMWAGLVATVAGIYVLGYALSWLNPSRWMAHIARTNIVAAIVLCLGLLAFLTPLADVQRLAVAGHLQHVAAAGGATSPDWRYLRWDSGRFGREALQAIANGSGEPVNEKWKKQATTLLAQKNAHEPGLGVMSDAQLLEKLRVFPRQQTLPASFVTHLQALPRDWAVEKCLSAEAGCAVWIGDLNRDGQNEILLFPSATGARGSVFVASAGGWQRAGSFSARGQAETLTSEQLEDARIAPPDWNDLLVNGQRIRMELNPSGR